MKALSLFSGIGGIDLAAEAAGIKTVAFCEREPFCREVLAYHWPGVPIFDDVCALRGEDVGTIDIIHGGPPCQPVSVAGKRLGKDDERYLWPECMRLVREIRPRWVVFENVSGIMRYADEICLDLQALDYSVRVFRYAASEVGAAHKRERVFFVANARRGAEPRPANTRERKKTCRKGAAADAGQASDVFGYVPDAEGNRRDARRPEREGQQGESQSIKCDLPLPDAERRELARQHGRLSQTGGFEERRRGTAQPGMGGVAHGIPCGVALHREPDIPRTTRGHARRAAKLKALGNAVVPAQIYPIFRAIMEVENEEILP